MNTRIPTYAEALQILEQIASFTMDGELDSDGEPFDMPSDDAVDTLHGCIRMARDALGIAQPTDCEECARSHGPHYNGPCAHA